MTTTPLTAVQLKQLMADLNPARIAHRKQGSGNGPQLSYLEAWDVRNALIRIFGFGGYSYSSETKILKIEDSVPKSRGDGVQFRVTAMATVRLSIAQLECSYEESAVSSQSQPDIGECADFAVKTAESDALKRCAVNLGTQFGLSLYNKGAQADVVKLVRAPGQAAIVTRLQQGETAASIDESIREAAGGSLAHQGVDLPEPTDADFSHGYDPDHGDTGLEQQAGAGEENQDQPMYQREVDPKRQNDARGALRDTFNRQPG